MMRAAHIMLAATLLGACAERAPLALHADIVYPHPEGETCDVEQRKTPRLVVSVADAAGGLFPGVALFMVEMGNTSAEVLRAVTDDAGIATFNPPSGGVYVVTAVLQAFSPEVRALTLRGGCTGSAKIVLKVGPTVVER
jgi:hypothetical protein